MNRKISLISSLILIFLLLSVACNSERGTPSPEANLPNPASVYCKEHGYQLEIITAEDGNQSAVCIFPDGSSCDEWAYFRGECRPSSSTSQPAKVFTDGWETYRDEVLTFSFQYPADATIQLDDNGHTVYVNGPVVDNNSWPVFMISFPDDREDFRVPLGTNLKQWLIDHNLYIDQPQPDATIAGTTVIHTRFPRGQQSFANDRFFFVHGEQMFVITILHAGDKENWDLYNRFLGSFKFE